ncbi:glycoside hydrolase family 2 protein [Jeotgalibacillus sp. ET6]|uniref:beta-mannosidase n=1 Tax=Jeotgalibacillus sp. ET6 TaxID=3037260 RepID=UPI002418A5FC|nr:glycoside hydrolase family 2 protein [Jeotgalibacillus sp. ET6]MDG5471535.1 glycoside hydrolase family 2 protein [Jeotgalibacillus sp. ET6]
MQIKLNGSWEMKTKGEEKIIEAVVPGSVMNDLLQAKQIDDPFFRDHEDQAYDIAAKDYVYSMKFTVSSDLLGYDRVLVRFEGLDTLTEIHLNGYEVAQTDNMHRIYEFDVKDFLVEGQNTLRVTLFSPIQFIAEKHAQQPLNGVEHAIEGYQSIRKAHSMFGWDWGPKIPDQGIWRDVSLLGFNEARIEDVYVQQHHSSCRVKLDVKVSTEKWKSGDMGMEVSILSPQGTVWHEHVKTDQTQETISFTIENPDLWWPNGYGNQPLYRVKTELKKDGRTVDAKEMTIGLRTIEVKHEPDQWGESFAFRVNGLSLFAMGANYIPEDSLLPRTNAKRTEKLIRDCTEANFNMIRVWGGGHYPDDYFYDLCDQYGLIVWQDFMFACSVYDITKEFEHTIKWEAVDTIKRIRHHASLGMWCGNNEVEEAWEHWGWPERSKYRSHYIKLFEGLLPDLVEQLDPQTFYWSSSPSSGGSFDQPKNPDVGDVHYWEVWHGLKPFTEYRKYHFRFCSEFGFQSFPSLKTVKTYTLPEDRNVFSYVMEKHQKNDGANGKILSYLADTFLYPKDFDFLLYTSQLLQGEAIKYGVEHWRRNRGRCMGSLYWQLNDCWPVASWSSVDYYGRWKALHYFAKRFYAPVLLSLKEEGTGVELHVTNDTLQDVTAEIEWKLRTNSSEILKQGKMKKDIPSLSAVMCEALSFAGELEKKAKTRETYLEAVLFLDGKQTASSTVLFTKPKHFAFLDPGLKFSVEEKEDHLHLIVSSSAFAKYTELDLNDADCTFSDNYFDISAGSPVFLTVQKDSLSIPLSLEQFKNQLKIRSIYDSAQRSMIEA